MVEQRDLVALTREFVRRLQKGGDLEAAEPRGGSSTTARMESVRSPTATVVPDVGLPVEERVAGLRTCLDAFLASVRRESS